MRSRQGLIHALAVRIDLAPISMPLIAESSSC
jgi:hypothetical protein